MACCSHQRCHVYYSHGCLHTSIHSHTETYNTIITPPIVSIWRPIGTLVGGGERLYYCASITLTFICYGIIGDAISRYWHRTGDAILNSPRLLRTCICYDVNSCWYTPRLCLISSGMQDWRAVLCRDSRQQNIPGTPLYVDTVPHTHTHSICIDHNKCNNEALTVATHQQQI